MHATSSANAPNLRSRKRLFMMFLLGLEMFYTRESLLVKYKVAERALTHKLAEYLQMLFCGYNVDCEYNKVGDGEPKRVEALVAKMRKVQKMQQGNKCNGDCNNCTPNKCVVFPDIIVHRRGKDRNLLVVEAKTEWGGASQNEDFEKLKALNEIASNRNQSLAEMALAWLLHNGAVTSVLVGASKPAQILANVKAAENTAFSDDELKEIDRLSK